MLSHLGGLGRGWEGRRVHLGAAGGGGRLLGEARVERRAGVLT